MDRSNKIYESQVGGDAPTGPHTVYYDDDDGYELKAGRDLRMDQLSHMDPPTEPHVVSGPSSQYPQQVQVQAPVTYDSGDQVHEGFNLDDIDALNILKQLGFDEEEDEYYPNHHHHPQQGMNEPPTRANSAQSQPVSVSELVARLQHQPQQSYHIPGMGMPYGYYQSPSQGPDSKPFYPGDAHEATILHEAGCVYLQANLEQTTQKRSIFISPSRNKNSEIHLFIGQLPFNFNQEGLARALTAVVGAGEEVVHMIIKGRPTCAFLVVHGEYAPVLLKYSKRILCNRNSLWVAPLPRSGGTEEDLLNSERAFIALDRVSQDRQKRGVQGVPDKPVVIEEVKSTTNPALKQLTTPMAPVHPAMIGYGMPGVRGGAQGISLGVLSPGVLVAGQPMYNGMGEPSLSTGSMMEGRSHSASSLLPTPVDEMERELTAGSETSFTVRAVTVPKPVDDGPGNGGDGEGKDEGEKTLIAPTFSNYHPVPPAKIDISLPRFLPPYTLPPTAPESLLSVAGSYYFPTIQPLVRSEYQPSITQERLPQCKSFELITLFDPMKLMALAPRKNLLVKDLPVDYDPIQLSYVFQLYFNSPEPVVTRIRGGCRHAVVEVQERFLEPALLLNKRMLLFLHGAWIAPPEYLHTTLQWGKPLVVIEGPHEIGDQITPSHTEKAAADLLHECEVLTHNGCYFIDADLGRHMGRGTPESLGGKGPVLKGGRQVFLGMLPSCFNSRGLCEALQLLLDSPKPIVVRFQTGSKPTCAFVTLNKGDADALLGFSSHVLCDRGGLWVAPKDNTIAHAALTEVSNGRLVKPIRGIPSHLMVIENVQGASRKPESRENSNNSMNSQNSHHNPPEYWGGMPMVHVDPTGMYNPAMMGGLPMMQSPFGYAYDASGMVVPIPPTVTVGVPPHVVQTQPQPPLEGKSNTKFNPKASTWVPSSRAAPFVPQEVRIGSKSDTPALTTPAAEAKQSTNPTTPTSEPTSTSTPASAPTTAKPLTETRCGNCNEPHQAGLVKAGQCCTVCQEPLKANTFARQCRSCQNPDVICTKCIRQATPS